MKGYVCTDIGKGRTVNQDAYYIPAQGESFAAVADGMGGHRAGEIASAMTITEFTRWLRWAVKLDEYAMKHAVAEANHVVFTEARRDPLKAGMGTTLTSIWQTEESILLAHVGDSRAYLYRDGAAIQLSKDHSLVNEMVENGTITYQEALVHPKRNVITRAVGTNSIVEPDILRIDYKPNDVWLLCTDGLSNCVSVFEIASVLGQSKLSWQEKCDELVRLALSHGGSDNITALIVTNEEN